MSMTNIELVEKAVHDFKAENDKALASKVDRAILDEQVNKAQAALFAKLDEHNDKVKAELGAISDQLEAMKLFGGKQEKAVDAESLERFCAITGNQVSAEDYATYQKTFDAYLRKGDKSGSIQAAMSVGSEPNGGYWVDDTRGGRMVEKIFETSPVRQYANVTSIGTDALTGPYDDGEASCGWVSETGARTETDTPTVGEWRIPVHEMYANPAVTQKLLDDAGFDVAGWLDEKVTAKIGRTQNTAFVTGDGNGKPKGFHTYAADAVTTADATRARDKFQYFATGASAAFAADPDGFDKLIDMIVGTRREYRANANFFGARSTLGAAMKLKGDDGQYLWKPMVRDGLFGISIHGYPFVEMEDIPVIAADSFSLAYGDLRETYQVVDRHGIRTLRDPYTNKPYVHFYTIARVGGDVLNFSSLKWLKFGS